MQDNTQSPTRLPDVVGDYVFTETTYSGSMNVQQIATAAPDRCWLCFSVQGGLGNANVSTKPNATTNQGIFFTSTASPFVLDSRHSPGLVGAAWYLGPVGSGTITVFEIFYRPRV